MENYVSIDHESVVGSFYLVEEPSVGNFQHEPIEKFASRHGATVEQVREFARTSEFVNCIDLRKYVGQ
jgi:hypothetical protein